MAILYRSLCPVPNALRCWSRIRQRQCSSDPFQQGDPFSFTAVCTLRLAAFTEVKHPLQFATLYPYICRCSVCDGGFSDGEQLLTMMYSHVDVCISLRYRDQRGRKVRRLLGKDVSVEYRLLHRMFLWRHIFVMKAWVPFIVAETGCWASPHCFLPFVVSRCQGTCLAYTNSGHCVEFIELNSHLSSSVPSRVNML